MSDVKVADTVRLNVGGTCFVTTRDTLCKYPASMLGAMFRGDIPAAVDETGAYFIDRDGALFGYILNFLRSSQLKVPPGFAHLEQLAVEADFFQIEPLTAAVNQSIPSMRKKQLPQPNMRKVAALWNHRDMQGGKSYIRLGSNTPDLFCKNNY